MKFFHFIDLDSALKYPVWKQHGNIMAIALLYIHAEVVWKMHNFVILIASISQGLVPIQRMLSSSNLTDHRYHLMTYPQGPT